MFHGPPDTDFAGGVYTGRINLPGFNLIHSALQHSHVCAPAEYPFKPPEIRILTVSSS